jgi:hypothetical protein
MKMKKKPITFYKVRIILMTKTNYTAYINHTGRNMNLEGWGCGLVQQ